MDAIRVLLESFWVFLSDPRWGPVQAFTTLLSILTFVVGLLRKGRAPARELQAPLSGLRKAVLDSRWRILERQYLGGLPGWQDLCTATLLGKREGVLLEQAYVSPRLVNYVPARLDLPQAAQIAPEVVMEPEDALAWARLIVILGEPGAGKTTLVKFAALAMARQNSDWSHYIRKVFPPGGHYPLPLYLDLPQLRNGSGSLVEDLAAFRPLREHFQPAEAQDYVRDRLLKGRCLVILNDMDGIEPEAKPKAIDRIESFLKKDIGPLTQVLVTSRIAGYVSLPGFSELAILPFTPYQVHSFLGKWFASQPEKVDGLEQTLDANPRMAELTATPLLLATIAFLYDLGLRRPEYRLPERKVELYERCAKGLLTEWDLICGRRRQARFSEGEKRAALELLSYGFHCKGRMHFSEIVVREQLPAILRQIGARSEEAEDFWREIVEWTGILHQGAGGTYSFIHSVFQEYFVACYLFKSPPDNKTLQSYLGDPWWQEVIVQLSGLRHDASEMVSVILNQPLSIPPLLLAARCLRDAANTPVAIKRSVVDPLLIWLFSGSEYRHEEYRAGLRDLGALMDDADWARLMALLNDPNPTRRVQAADIAGYLSHPRALPALIDRLEDGDDKVRAGAAEALRRIGRPAVLPLIAVAQQPDDSIRRQQAAHVLGWLRDPRALKPLLAMLKDPDHALVRAAALALGRMDEVPVHALMELMFREPAALGESIAVSLGMIGKPAIRPLIRALDRENEIIHHWSREALVHMGDVALVPMLECLGDPVSRLRQGAAYVLGRIGDSTAVDPLVRVLDDPTPAVRQEAVSALVLLGESAIGTLLAAATQSRSERVRCGSAVALGGIGDRRAVPALLRAAFDRKSAVRKAAIEAIGQWPDEPVLLVLIRSLQDHDPKVKIAAIYALGRIGNPEAVPALELVLRDRDTSVRVAASEALGQVGGSKAAESLLVALKDSNWRVRRAAIRGVTALGDVRAIPSLVTMLGDKDSDTRRVAVEALVQFGSAAVDLILPVLDDQRPIAREAALRVLSMVHDGRAVEPMLRALGHAEAAVREAAARALGGAGATDACGPLIEALNDVTTSVRRAAAQALGQLACAAAVEALSAALASSSNPDWRVRLDIAEALGRIGDIQGSDALCATLRSDPSAEVRISAVRALGQIGAANALDVLGEALHDDPIPAVRVAIAQALGQIGDTRGRQSLITAQADRHPDVREAAAEAMTHLRSQEQKAT